MRRVWYISLSLCILLLCCACTHAEEVSPITDHSSSLQTTAEDKEIQYMTLVRTNSPPVCKTTYDKAAIQSVKERIRATPRTEYSGPPVAGWRLKIDFEDGSRFSLARSHMTIDHIVYTIEEADYTALYTTLMDVYDSIDAEEIEYGQKVKDSLTR